MSTGPWKPKPRLDVPLESLQLSAREAFVLSRFDGATSLEEAAQLTQLPVDELRAHVERLVTAGALEPGPQAAPAPEASAEPEPTPEEEAADAAQSVTHRQRYEQLFRELTEAERAARALGATDPDLSALCFDPLPVVVMKVLENPRTGLAHARLLASHHRTAAGLDALGRRAEWLRDAEVQRRLLRNAQAPESLLRRMLTSRRLSEVFKLLAGREVAERARPVLREVFRGKFAQATAEERVALIFQTEGRVLMQLVGVPVDAKTVALLCGRTYHSLLLVQQLARWTATTPALAAHLLKQPLVARHPQLRALLLAKK